MQAVCGKPWAGTSDTQLFFYFCCTTFSLESLQCRPRVIETLPPELSQAFEIWTAPECILRRCNIHLKFLKKKCLVRIPANPLQIRATYSDSVIE